MKGQLPRLSIRHYAIMAVTLLLWGVWIAWSVLKTDMITHNDRSQTIFGLLASLMIIAHVASTAAIVYPDFSYTSKKFHDGNRDILYYYRRITYALFQLIATFFLGGVSISLYYASWRIGFSVVIPIFLAVSIALLIWYGFKVATIAKMPPPVDDSKRPQVYMPVYNNVPAENSQDEDNANEKSE